MYHPSEQQLFGLLLFSFHEERLWVFSPFCHVHPRHMWSSCRSLTWSLSMSSTPFDFFEFWPHLPLPFWWNDACYHALVARKGSWRDFRRSGSLEDKARFRFLRQQFHSTIRSSRTRFWNEWLGSVTSLSHRAPGFACSLIGRTFRSPVLTPDFCHVQWHGASRSALANFG